ncbi:Eco57I restriction-modification methylase domain-containing protein [Leptolyngbya sp. AN03gr2]|uniref:Eco57I restriction-modification methylase domain-containing protein n=1 Tax=unclassified Leptolyngbya TaxID=2650499 RepID=UPI003D311B6D
MINRTDKALFNRKILNQAVSQFVFPLDLKQKHQTVLQWMELLESGTLYQAKEVSLHGDFLRDIFQDVLGYRSVIAGGGKLWELAAEATIANGGGSADGAIGFFSGRTTTGKKVQLEGRVIAPIELKGAKVDLDRQKASESPVDQGWRYANHSPGCRWVLVSNYIETRIYQTTKSTAFYEAFFLEDLKDLEAFKRFYFLLCRQNFLPLQSAKEQESRIDRLLKESESRQEEVTEDLYAEYKSIRELLVNDFIRLQQTESNQELVLIEKAQKLLDRVLFIAFCEDQGLLPRDTLKNAYQAKNPYVPMTVWELFKQLFRWVDRGNSEPPIAGYNGGLFAYDPVLDETLTVPDSRCERLVSLTRFEFDTDVSADVLGRIFEQSITDLEALKAEKTGQKYDKAEQKKGKRKTQGVYYTPAWVTQYIVSTAIGGYLTRREMALRDRYPTSTATDEQRFWLTYRDEVLKTVRVVDPACGSGAFLIAALDFLRGEHDRVNRQLAALGIETEDAATIDKHLLTENLFGVDLSPESVEITKLSLWLKTATPGKTLTNLDGNVRFGNSIVSDRSTDMNAFDWAVEFAAVFATGGFDVVIGNPPYVRQEFLSHVKPYLQANYASYDGVADLYTYFYEQGINILKPDGVLSYIVTNKWFRSGYGEPLRRFFTENCVFDQIIDFGHAPIFQDADTFPCIVVARKKQKIETETQQKEVIVCPVPREKLSNLSLTDYVRDEGYEVPWNRFSSEAWSLEIPDVDKLMQKIQKSGVPLKEFVGIKPVYGIKTGYNEAFLIDDETRKRLIQLNPKSGNAIKACLRGQDIKRWKSNWQELWMIVIRQEAELEDYPEIKDHLEQYRSKLEARAGKQAWWEHQGSLASYEVFEKPKIVYPDIIWRPQFALSEDATYLLNTSYLCPSSDLYLLAALNSPLMWAYMWRNCVHAKDEALRMFNPSTETLPIAEPTPEIRSQVEPLVQRLIEITQANQSGYRDVHDWLRSRFRMEKLGQKLETFATLSKQDLIEEVRNRIPKAGSKSSDRLGIAGMKEVTEVYNEYALPIQTRAIEAQKLERQLSDLINQAYGLTPEEIDLMWKTAPPRMPMASPRGNATTNPLLE